MAKSAVKAVGVSAEDIINVLNAAAAPLTTQALMTQLAEQPKFHGAIIMNGRYRRMLNQLEADGKIVASGGPNRPELPGWPTEDRRDVQWATPSVADDLAAAVEEAAREAETRVTHRVNLLKALHKTCVASQREALGLVGVTTALRDDPYYLSPNGGATCWTIEELETVVDLIGVEW